MKALICSFALVVFANHAVAEEWVSVGASQRVAPAVAPPTRSQTSTSRTDPSPVTNTSSDTRPASDGGLVYEMWQQMELLQQEISMLRSQVETQQHQLQQFENTQQQRYLDLDRRLSMLTTHPKSPVVVDSQETLPDISATTNSTASSAPVSVNVEQQYQAAMRLVRDREFDAAIDAFSAFTKQHAQHVLMPNALYWLAEVYLVQNDNKRALANFKRVMDAYPEHDKAADSMYKYAVTLHRQGDAVAAKQWLQTVIDRYADRSSSTVQLAKSYLANLQ